MWAELIFEISRVPAAGICPVPSLVMQREKLKHCETSTFNQAMDTLEERLF